MKKQKEPLRTERTSEGVAHSVRRVRHEVCATPTGSNRTGVGRTVGGAPQ